jgi:hypothetical protein
LCAEHVHGEARGRQPGHQQAVEQAPKYNADGYRWVVDPEKFFDRVNYDKLKAKIAERVSISHGWST